MTGPQPVGLETLPSAEAAGPVGRAVSRYSCRHDPGSPGPGASLMVGEAMSLQGWLLGVGQPGTDVEQLTSEARSRHH